MRLAKRTFHLSLIISIITLLSSVIITFYINTDTYTDSDIEIIKYINNISQNIFAGTIIMVLTSLFEYFIRRKENFTAMMENCLKFISLFAKLDYLDILSYEEYGKAFKKDKDKNYATEYSEHLEKKYGQDIDKVITVYKDICSIDFNAIWRIYDDHSFIMVRSKKVKEKLYYDYFEYLSSLKNEIFTHLSRLEEPSRRDIEYLLKYEVINAIQKPMFDIYERQNEDEWDIPYNRADIRETKIQKNKITYFFNKEYINMCNLFNELGKKAYCNKNYNGLERE